MIKNIVFDVMGVIFKVGDDTNELLVPFLQKINNSLSRSFINEKYIDASLGEISSKDFWFSMGISESSIKKTEIQYLKVNFEMITQF